MKKTKKISYTSRSVHSAKIPFPLDGLSAYFVAPNPYDVLKNETDIEKLREFIEHCNSHTGYSPWKWDRENQRAIARQYQDFANQARMKIKALQDHELQILELMTIHPANLSGIKSAAKTIAKNVKNAFKNLSLPEITNNSGNEIDDIPETLADRKAMLERMLVPLIGTKKYCTGLRDFAEITGGSVPEICYHASKNKASTLAALCLLDVIAAAKYIPPPTPPHGSTQAKRHISEMYELRCKIKGLGVVKLTIGKRAYNSDMVYCITKFRFDKIKKNEVSQNQRDERKSK